MLLAVKGSQTGLAYSNTGRTNALYAEFGSLNHIGNLDVAPEEE